MPVMNGFDAVAQIRSTPEIAQTVVVGASASVFRDDQWKSIEAGMNEFLSKPIMMDELVEVLSKTVHPNWIYLDGHAESAEEELTNETQVAKPDMTRPDQAALDQMREWLEIGDLDRIERQAEQMRSAGEHVWFAEKLIELVHAYQEERIQLLLEGHE